jgi:3-oxoacyl-[acyl-carrier-protein] synthase II
MQRVFVTGIGVVAPVGNSKREFWDALVAGRSGIRKLESIDVTDLPVTIGGEVRNLATELANVNDKVSVRRMDKASIFAVIAAREALADAGLDPDKLGQRCGVVVGSGLAGLITLQEQTENLLTKGPRSVSPLTIPILMPNAAPANISLAFNITGPTYNVASACASSGHAMIDAFELLREGLVDVMITGGTEAAMTRLSISAFGNMRATTRKYNDRPEKASRPFDADRDGFVMSEGACILVFETEEYWQRRGGRAYAEFVGFGSTMDAFHLVQPDPSAVGATQAVQGALNMAGWDPAAIADQTYVNAHGTSTKFNDLMETMALKQVFDGEAQKLQISSTKSVTGHLIGAACAVEMAACALALDEGVLPPTINYETPDPECDLDYTPNTARKAQVRYALNNSFGFGGHNVCLALQKV